MSNLTIGSIDISKFNYSPADFMQQIAAVAEKINTQDVEVRNLSTIEEADKVYKAFMADVRTAYTGSLNIQIKVGNKNHSTIIANDRNEYISLRDNTKLDFMLSPYAMESFVGKDQLFTIDLLELRKGIDLIEMPATGYIFPSDRPFIAVDSYDNRSWGSVERRNLLETEREFLIALKGDRPSKFVEEMVTYLSQFVLKNFNPTKRTMGVENTRITVEGEQYFVPVLDQLKDVKEYRLRVKQVPMAISTLVTFVQEMVPNFQELFASYIVDKWCISLKIDDLVTQSKNLSDDFIESLDVNDGLRIVGTSNFVKQKPKGEGDKDPWESYLYFGTVTLSGKRLPGDACNRKDYDCGIRISDDGKDIVSIFIASDEPEKPIAHHMATNGKVENSFINDIARNEGTVQSVINGWILKVAISKHYVQK